MKAGPIVFLVGTAAIVGWIAPGLSSGNDAAKESAAQEAGQLIEDKAKESDHEAWLTGGTVLDRAYDGHFYADARVDSRSTHFLVDTGASIVALTGDDARAIGLDWNEEDLVQIGRGASGDVFGVPVRLESVELGGFEAENVDAAIVPEGLDVSLLGQSFLSRVRGVNIDGDRMVIGAGS